MRHLPAIFLCLLLVWVPLPFGSVTPWAVTVLVIAVGLAAMASSFSGVSTSDLKVARGPLAALFAVGALGLVQASSWAGRLFGTLSADLPEHLSGSARPSLSLVPSLSRQAAVGWWTLALLLAVSLVAARSRRARPLLLVAALASAAFQAIYGLRQIRRSPGEIWGVLVGGPERFRGTLVVSDHLATFCTILMAICLGWSWWAWRTSRREPRLARRLALLIPPVVAWGCAFAGVVVSGSRAGLAAAVVGLVFQTGLVARMGRNRWVPIALALAILAGGWFVVSRGPAAHLGRQFSRPVHEILTSERFAVWRPALGLWAESPVFGTGLGTFGEAFTRVQPVEIQGARWGRAHNDPLELLVTGGLVGFGLFGLALVLLVRRLWKVYRTNGHLAVRASALAALLALPPVALHEFFDFGLTIPANAVFLTVLLGIGAAGPTAVEEGASPLPSSAWRRPPR